MIITALEEERDAVLALLPDHRLLERDGQQPHTYYEARVRSKRSDGAVYRVLVSSLVGMGPLQAAAKALAVVHHWHPRHVLLVGIAGGVSSAAGLGDVLVASQIADYTVGKQTSEQRKVRWEVHRADADLLDAASNFARGWEDLLTGPRPGEGMPRRRIGVILSGGDVIADAQVIQSNQEVWDKLVGVETEGGAVALALHSTQERPRFLMIRGVSDFADEKKNSAEVLRWRPYACDVAAAYAVGLIRSGLIAPVRVHPIPFPRLGLILLAAVLLSAGAAWMHLRRDTTVVPPAQRPEPVSPPIPETTQAPTSQPPPSPGGTGVVPDPNPAARKGRVSTPSTQPSAQPGCQEVDKPQADGDLRAYCYCGETLVGEPSSAFRAKEPEERKRVLHLDSWSCPPKPNTP